MMVECHCDSRNDLKSELAIDLTKSHSQMDYSTVADPTDSYYRALNLHSSNLWRIQSNSAFKQVLQVALILFYRIWWMALHVSEYCDTLSPARVLNTAMVARQDKALFKILSKKVPMAASASWKVNMSNILTKRIVEYLYWHKLSPSFHRRHR
jgi:hypothetical protein